MRYSLDRFLFVYILKVISEKFKRAPTLRVLPDNISSPSYFKNIYLFYIRNSYTKMSRFVSLSIVLLFCLHSKRICVISVDSDCVKNRGTEAEQPVPQYFSKGLPHMSEDDLLTALTLYMEIFSIASGAHNVPIDTRPSTKLDDRPVSYTHLTLPTIYSV